VPTEAETNRRIADLRAELRSHPVHGCPDREAHARWARRYAKAEAQREALDRSMRRRTGSLIRQFDQISAVLEGLGYLDGGEVTAAGRTLARIYAEKDLVIAECVRTGVWAKLEAPALAAAVTALVYEPRSEAESAAEELDGAVRPVIAAEIDAWSRVAEQEERHGVSLSPGVESGASGLVWRWANGATLARTLAGDAMPPGDFVRLVNRVVDVLDHIRGVAPDADLYDAAASATRKLRRGVVTFDPQ
jgi:ATP-dependent RNA helicase HelY